MIKVVAEETTNAVFVINEYGKFSEFGKTELLTVIDKSEEANTITIWMSQKELLYLEQLIHNYLELVSKENGVEK